MGEGEVNGRIRFILSGKLRVQSMRNIVKERLLML